MGNTAEIERFESGPAAARVDLGDSPGRVLIVEDDAPFRRALAGFIRAEGFEVEEVGDGEAALAAVSERRPDIIVLDLVLPKLDGYQVMEALAARYGRGRPRVLVMSAAERLNLARVRMDADAYLAKPFHTDRMRAALDRLAVSALRRTR